MKSLLKLTCIWKNLPRHVYAQDSDYQFNINVWYSYDACPTYFVEHKGSQYEFSDSFENISAAEFYLAKELIKQIKEQVNTIDANPQEFYHNSWFFSGTVLREIEEIECLMPPV